MQSIRKSIINELQYLYSIMHEGALEYGMPALVINYRDSRHARIHIWEVSTCRASTLGL